LAVVSIDPQRWPKFIPTESNSLKYLLFDLQPLDTVLAVQHVAAILRVCNLFSPPGSLLPPLRVDRHYREYIIEQT
jgi:hypothetical protein